MPKYHYLTDSDNVNLTLVGLLSGNNTATVDFGTPLKGIINSKKSAQSEPFSEQRSFFTLSPTVINLMKNRGDGKLEERINEDMAKTVSDLCSIVSSKEEKISDAYFLVLFDPAYVPGNLYKVELVLCYR